jgi:hypothetical protein
VQAQWSGSLDEEARVPIRPDITWWRAPPQPGHLPDAGLLHRPSPPSRLPDRLCPADDDKPSSYVIRNAGIEIIVKSLDLAAEPAELLEGIENLRLTIESGTRTTATRRLGAAG